MSFYAGLDLGQSADFTALAVVQDVKEMNETTTPGKPERRLLLRHLERYPLRTPYPEIASQAGALMRDPHLSPNIFDGVGIARQAPAARGGRHGSRAGRHRPPNNQGLALHGRDHHRGIRPTAPPRRRDLARPKRDLVAALEVPFHAGTLKVAEGLQLWPARKEELINFRRKINMKTAFDSKEHWRERHQAEAGHCHQDTRAHLP